MSTTPIKLEPHQGAHDPAHLEGLTRGDIFACDFAGHGGQLPGTAVSPERYASELEAWLARALASMIRA